MMIDGDKSLTKYTERDMSFDRPGGLAVAATFI